MRNHAHSQRKKSLKKTPHPAIFRGDRAGRFDVFRDMDQRTMRLVMRLPSRTM